jgi:hypothetical protein
MTELKRRFWQIHLSTAILLMFVAAVFLLLNTRTVEVQAYYEAASGGLLSIVRTPDGAQRGFGWPRAMYSDGRGGHIDSEAVVWNSLFFLCSIALLAVCCEVRIRRRKPGES